MPEARKSAAKKTDRPAEPTPAPVPAREAIAKRAYELYLQRGSVAGYELEDWLAAEAELIAAAVEHGGS
jgi:hypothetical protein